MSALPLLMIGDRTAAVMVALGDSNTVGVGADRSWAFHLSHALGAQLTCTAVNGARASDVRFSQLPKALGYQPSLATVLVGGNDVLRGDFDPPAVHRHIAATVEKLERAGSTVLLITPPTQVINHLPLPLRLRRTMRTRLLQLRSAVTSVGGSRGPVLHLDSDPVLDYAGSAALHIDRIHLSPLGHRLLALNAAALLQAHGWEQRGTIGRPPRAAVPGAGIAWLAMEGIPWLAQRRRDFLPELLRASRPARR